MTRPARDQRRSDRLAWLTWLTWSTWLTLLTWLTWLTCPSRPGCLAAKTSWLAANDLIVVAVTSSWLPSPHNCLDSKSSWFAAVTSVASIYQHQVVPAAWLPSRPGWLQVVMAAKPSSQVVLAAWLLC